MSVEDNAPFEYNFRTHLVVIPSEYKRYSPSVCTMVDMVAAAIIAYEVNGNTVLKFSDQDYNSDNLLIPNRSIMLDLLSTKSPVIDAIRVDAEEMVNEMKKAYMLKLLTGDRISDFELNIYRNFDEDVVSSNKCGLLAYIPRIHNQNVNKETRNYKLRNSEFIGEVGTRINLDIVIFFKSPETIYQGWHVTGMTTDGNAVSFFTSKENIANASELKVSARVKSHQYSYANSHIKETRLNHVKHIL